MQRYQAGFCADVVGPLGGEHQCELVVILISCLHHVGQRLQVLDGTISARDAAVSGISAGVEVDGEERKVQAEVLGGVGIGVGVGVGVGVDIRVRLGRVCGLVVCLRVRAP
jgi:hypothetical protein